MSRQHALLIIQTLAWIAIGGAILHWLPISPTQVIALGSITSSITVALGLSLSNVIQNFIAGKVIQFRGEFYPGDEIECNSRKGAVLSFRLLDVLLQSAKGHIAIPNSVLLSSPVEVYGKDYT